MLQSSCLKKPDGGGKGGGHCFYSWTEEKNEATNHGLNWMCSFSARNTRNLGKVELLFPLSTARRHFLHCFLSSLFLGLSLSLQEWKNAVDAFLGPLCSFWVAATWLSLISCSLLIF